MNFTDIEVLGSSTSGLQDFTITQSGMTVSVHTGAFTAKGIARSLDTQADFVATADATYDTEIYGYLVIENSSGDVIVVVDEIILDGVDRPYVFDDSDLYELLERLYHFVVPANATDLDSVDCDKWVLKPGIENHS